MEMELNIKVMATDMKGNGKRAERVAMVTNFIKMDANT